MAGRYVFALDHPFALGIACIALIAGSYFCYRALGTDLLPAMDEGGFILDYLMPAGSSLEDTNKVLLGVEKILQSTPEVAGTSRRTGLQLGLAQVTEANNGDFTVRLKPPPRRGIDKVISEVRAKVKEKYPQLDVEFAAFARHDRRLDQLARADGDQAVLSRPGTTQNLGTQNRREC